MLASWFHPSGIQKKLQNVRHLQSTYSAFAAILEDGSVVTWGDSKAGGNSTGVRKRLKQLGCYGCRNVPQNTVLWVCVCVWKHLETRRFGFVVFFGSGGRSTMTSLLPTKILVIRWWYNETDHLSVPANLWWWNSVPLFGFLFSVKLLLPIVTKPRRSGWISVAVPTALRHMAVAFTTNFRSIFDAGSTYFWFNFDSFWTNFRWMSDPISTIFRPIKSWRTSTNFGLQLHPDDWLQ